MPMLFRLPAKTMLLLVIFAGFLILHIFLFNGEQDFSDLVLSARWLLALPLAALLKMLLNNKRNVRLFCYCIITGCIGNVLIMALESAGLKDKLIKIGLMPAKQLIIRWVLGEERYSGLWEHPNATMAIVSVCLFACLWLFRTRVHGLWIVALGWLIMLGGFYFTQTRSPIIYGALLTLGVLASDPAFARRAMLVGMGLVMLTGVAIIGPPGGWERWQNQTDQNLNQRTETTLLTFGMTFESPFGNSLNEIQTIQLVQAGVNSSHNGFAYMGAIYGWPLLLAMVALFINALRQKNPANDPVIMFYKIMSAQVFLLQFSEDLPSGPTFAVLICLCFMTGIRPVSRDAQSATGLASL